MIDWFIQSGITKPFDCYADRIEGLHFCQSTKGLLADVFTMDGDIDYNRLFEFLVKKGIGPHLVIELPVVWLTKLTR